MFSSKKTIATWETVEPAASGSMNQIQHLYSSVIIQLVVKNISSSWSNQFEIGWIIHIIVERFQLSVGKIGKHLREASLSFAKKNRISVFGNFFAMEHC